MDNMIHAHVEKCGRYWKKWTWCEAVFDPVTRLLILVTSDRKPPRSRRSTTNRKPLSSSTKGDSSMAARNGSGPRQSYTIVYFPEKTAAIAAAAAGLAPSGQNTSSLVVHQMKLAAQEDPVGPWFSGNNADVKPLLSFTIEGYVPAKKALLRRKLDLAAGTDTNGPQSGQVNSVTAAEAADAALAEPGTEGGDDAGSLFLQGGPDEMRTRGKKKTWNLRCRCREDLIHMWVSVRNALVLHGFMPSVHMGMTKEDPRNGLRMAFLPLHLRHAYATLSERVFYSFDLGAVTLFADRRAVADVGGGKLTELADVLGGGAPSADKPEGAAGTSGHVMWQAVCYMCIAREAILLFRSKRPAGKNGTPLSSQPCTPRKQDDTEDIQRWHSLRMHAKGTSLTHPLLLLTIPIPELRTAEVRVEAPSHSLQGALATNIITFASTDNTVNCLRFHPLPEVAFRGKAGYTCITEESKHFSTIRVARRQESILERLGAPRHGSSQRLSGSTCDSPSNSLRSMGMSSSIWSNRSVTDLIMETKQEVAKTVGVKTEFHPPRWPRSQESHRHVDPYSRGGSSHRLTEPGPKPVLLSRSELNSSLIRDSDLELHLSTPKGPAPTTDMGSVLQV